jgi:hypothetical protein
MRTLPWSLLFAAIIFFIPRPASAGPPFLTDDPEPLLQHHGEFLIAPQIISTIGGFSMVLPGIEFNYGLTNDIMTHVIAPFVLTKQDGAQSAFSLGDVELGFKYRFLEESNHVPQAGFFPHLEIPAGDLSKSAGTGAFELFLPLWLQWDFGHWTTYGGGGIWLQFSSGSNDFWFFGWEIQRDLSEKLTLGAELFGTTGSFESASAEIGLTIGGSYNFSDVHHLLFSLGREIKGPDRFLMYLAYQLTFALKQI